MEFGTYDIETDSNGNLLDIGVWYRGSFYVFPDWPEFFKFIKSEKPILYAHNGGRFDVVGFAIWLFNNYETFEAAVKQGRIINLKIGRASLRDSFCLLQGSLNDLARTFGVQMKLEHDFIERMEDFKASDSARYYEYLKRDCQSLYEILCRFDAELKEICDYGNLKVTIGATALAIYKKAFQPFKIFLPNPTEKKITRQSMRGGRCEMFQAGRRTRVSVYDVNSLYPAMMRYHKFPFRGGVRVSEIIRENGTIAAGIYRVKFVQKTGNIPILINDNRTYVFEGIAWATHHELNYLEELGGQILEVLDGYHYEFTDYIFKDYVDTLYYLKQNARDNASRTIYKYLLNNLYGKFSQRDENEVMKVLPMEDARNLVMEGLEVVPLIESEDFGIYTFPEKSKFTTGFPAIASMVTAAGRVYLTRILEYYKENILYCDTDSIHLWKIKMDDALISDSELGLWKCEYEDVNAVYFGRKQYVIENEKIVQKGIPKRAIPDNFTDLMLSGGADIEFRSPAQFKTAIKYPHENPNEFKIHKRRVVPQPPTKYKNPFKDY